MSLEHTAVILVGFQNDYFSPDGVLNAVVRESARLENTVANTITLLECLATSPVRVAFTPICFQEGYPELPDPVGILETIRDVGAFRHGSEGAEAIPELAPFRDVIEVIPGKFGFNAFAGTRLDETLRSWGVDQVIIAGAVTSICIDSTGRAAHERGYKTTIVSDCTAGRSAAEQRFYCEEIFPLYAQVLTCESVLDRALCLAE